MAASSRAVHFLGLETEHLLVWRDAGITRPRGQACYAAMEGAICGLVPWLPSRYRLQEGRFLGNGARVYFEQNHEALLAGEGLLELASAECADPPSLLAHERGLEALLELAAPEAETSLWSEGYRGRLEVARPSRDAYGNGLGSHENLNVDDRLGWGSRALLLGAFLPAWLLLFVLPVSLLGLTALGVVIVSGAAALAAALLLSVVAVLPLGRWRSALPALPFRLLERLAPRALRALAAADAAVTRVPGPVLGPLAGRIFLRRYLAHLPTLLALREVLCGDGAWTAEGFRLSGRALGIRRGVGLYAHGPDRPMVDLKHALFPSFWRGATRRLHVLLSPACMLPEARRLRTGLLTLAAELLGRGPAELRARLPRLRDPVAALHALNRDPWLGRPLTLADGRVATALELLRQVQGALEAFVASEPAPAPWQQDLLTRLEAALTDLETATRDRAGDDGAAALGALRGRLDWVGKRALLLELGGGRVPGLDDPRAEAARKIDLRWHVVAPADEGYARRMAEAAGAPWGSPGGLRGALDPPAGTRAARRAALIREARERGVGGVASWAWVKLEDRARERL